jgi:hypothetical protein
MIRDCQPEQGQTDSLAETVNGYQYQIAQRSNTHLITIFKLTSKTDFKTSCDNCATFLPISSSNSEKILSFRIIKNNLPGNNHSAFEMQNKRRFHLPQRTSHEIAGMEVV